MSPFAHITGWGMAVPEKILTNVELAKRLDTDDAGSNRIPASASVVLPDEEQTTASLAADAALQALEVARLEPIRDRFDHCRNLISRAYLPGDSLPGAGPVRRE